MPEKNIEIISKTKRSSLEHVADSFGVIETVRSLQGLMKEVTKNEVTSDSVNAACNCVQNINLTIKTAIQAARYLSEE